MWLPGNAERIKHRNSTAAVRRLDAGEEASLQRTVIDSTPEQLKLPFMLLEWRAVQELVARKFGIGMPLQAAGEYLLRLSLSCQASGHGILRAEAPVREAVDG